VHASALGWPDLPMVVIRHPLAGIGESEARERGRAVAHEVLALVDEMQRG